jgi:hypothetical protein
MLASDDPRAAELSENPNCSLASLNTIIAICGLYFGQAEGGRGYTETADPVSFEDFEDVDVGDDDDDDDVVNVYNAEADSNETALIIQANGEWEEGEEMEIFDEISNRKRAIEADEIEKARKR